jgi:hypothetical protein
MICNKEKPCHRPEGPEFQWIWLAHMKFNLQLVKRAKPLADSRGTHRWHLGETVASRFTAADQEAADSPRVRRPHVKPGRRLVPRGVSESAK